MEHPITPPQELVMQWRKRAPVFRDDATREQWLVTQAARWGADQELEACCEWMHVQHLSGLACQLRTTRRPKPPSLKEQALNQLAALEQHGALSCNTDTIRRALEALSDD